MGVPSSQFLKTVVLLEVVADGSARRRHAAVGGC